MTETIVGLNIRQEATSRSAKLGILPRGARIEVGERSSDGKWAKIAKVIEGQIAPVKAGDPVNPNAAGGWVFLGELDPDTAEPELDTVVKVDPPRPIKAGQIVGHLGEYQRFEDAKAVPERGRRALAHVEVFSGDDVPAFIARCRAYAEKLPESERTLLVVESAAKFVQPSEPDVALTPGQQLAAAGESSERWVKVKRRETKIVPRSSLGSYSSATKSYSTGEAWTGWYVGASDDQRTQNEREAERLGYNRREVTVTSGPELWVERSALGEGGSASAGWSKFPLDLANANTEVGFTLVISRAQLDALPAEDKAVDPEGKKWWRLRGVVPTGKTSRHAGAGWVREAGHEKVSWQSPWAWPGFELVSEGEVRPADFKARDLLRDGVAMAREEGDFKARADKAEGSALVTKIYEQIDADGDGNLDAQELKAAMQQPLMARALARIIAHYESEWGGEMAKWDELDPLMLDGAEEWKVEKQRIEALRWWTEVAAKVEGFPQSPEVHHIHPIALVANFLGSGGGCPNCEAEITAAQLKQIFPSASDERIEEVRAVFNEAYKKFEIVTCRRKAHFFAQVREEVGASIRALAESLNYKPEALKSTFSYFARNPAEAEQYGRTAAHPADQVAIANRAYANRNGNGDIASGDGWRYRGKGYLQLTGRGNFQSVQTEINRRYPGSNVDIMADGDQILSPRGGMVSAMGFWTLNGLNAIADRGDSDAHVNAVTEVINRHTKSYAERRGHFNTTKVAFKVAECTDGRGQAGTNQAAK
jgi:predicted chitinase